MSGVYSDRGVRCAWPAGDEGDTGFASHLAPGIGHVGDAAFLSAYDKFDLVMNVVERIERREIAFPGTQNTVSTPCRRRQSTKICPPVRRLEEEPSGMLFVLKSKSLLSSGVCPGIRNRHRAADNVSRAIASGQLLGQPGLFIQSGDAKPQDIVGHRLFSLMSSTFASGLSQRQKCGKAATPFR